MTSRSKRRSESRAVDALGHAVHNMNAGLFHQIRHDLFRGFTAVITAFPRADHCDGKKIGIGQCAEIIQIIRRIIHIAEEIGKIIVIANGDLHTETAAVFLNGFGTDFGPGMNERSIFTFAQRQNIFPAGIFRPGPFRIAESVHQYRHQRLIHAGNLPEAEQILYFASVHYFFPLNPPWARILLLKELIIFFFCCLPRRAIWIRRSNRRG